MWVEYSSNNSGGSWWLKDKDWKALAKAGWVVQWISDMGLLNDYRSPMSEGGRFLGATATSAWFFVEGEKDEDYAIMKAKDSFISAVHQDPEEEGCSCCGQPHNFYKAYDQNEPIEWLKAQDRS